MLRLSIPRRDFPFVSQVLFDAMVHMSALINGRHSVTVFDASESVFKESADPSVKELALASAHGSLSDLAQDFEWSFANEDEHPIAPDPLYAHAGYGSRMALKLAYQLLDASPVCLSTDDQKRVLNHLLKQFAVFEVETPALLTAEVIRIPHHRAS